MYPPDWPRCRCGDFALDGHLTCGRVECDESDARRHSEERPATEAEINANLERNHNIPCGCATPNEGACALVSR